MKVLDLQCDATHVFEGWFASEQDYQDQAAKGLVTCPLCNSATVVKMLSAPRLNLRSTGMAHVQEEPASASDTSVSAKPAQAVTSAGEVQANAGHSATATSISTDVATMPGPNRELQAQMMQAMREVLKHTEDVGSQFADQARAMHYGEVEPKAIRGQTSSKQARELADEGIDVMPLLLPEAFKKPLQ